MRRVPMVSASLMALALVQTPAWGLDTAPADASSRLAQDRATAQALTVLPSLGLLGGTLAIGNPWVACAIPFSFGLGHAYAGDYPRSAMITVAGPLVAGGGFLVGGVLGDGLARLSFPGDFNPSNEMPPLGSMLFTGLFAAAGLTLGTLGTWGWAYQDLGRLYDERQSALLGPLSPTTTDSDAAP